MFTMEVDEELSPNPIVHLRLGSSFVKFKPLLSSNSKCLFCCCGHVVRVVSTSTGQCIRELRGHSDVVTSVKSNPKNSLQVFTASLDHTIRQWDYTDGVLLKVYHVNFPLHGMLVPGFEDGSVMAIRQCTEKGYDLVSLPLSQKVTSSIKPTTVLQSVSFKETNMCVGVRNEYLASVLGYKLTVLHFERNRSYDHWCCNDRSKSFTCVACHPTELCLATGCSDGVIFLWYNFMGEKKVIKTINHWHALPVGSLTFTTEGSYLLSGGHECVLVKWQLNSQHKDFLPRLGAPINHVTCSHDNTMYVTSHTDNALHIISNTLRLQQVLQGLTRGHCDVKHPDPLPAGLLFDKRSQSLVLNGKPGHLQFYSLYTDKQLFNLDIVQQNYISAENIKRPLVITEVENAAFSEDGSWLTTVERRDDGITSMESKLKFWLFDSTSQTYTLNTSVDMPHSAKVNSVTFRPVFTEFTDDMLMVVTSSDDGKFKLWQLVDDTDIYRANHCWSCESVGYYRDLPAGSTAFSDDGSILAVVFGSAVTLWDPDSNALKTSLRHGDENIKNVLFGHGHCCHIMITSSTSKLTAWNLLSCTVLWSLSMSVDVLVSDPYTNQMAAFTSDSELLVFSPASPDSIYKHHSVSRSPVMAAIFIPQHTSTTHTLTWQNQSQLYFMNRHQELLTVTHESSLHSSNTVNVEQNLPQTPFSLLMAEKTRKDVKSVTLSDGLIGQTGLQAVTQLLSSPANVLPPTTNLCGTFIKSLLVKVNSGFRENEVEEDEDDDLKTNTTTQYNSEDSDSDMDIDIHEKQTGDLMTNQETTHIKSVPEEDFSFIASVFP